LAIEIRSTRLTAEAIRLVSGSCGTGAEKWALTIS
jgi:hypothetical protein